MYKSWDLAAPTWVQIQPVVLCCTWFPSTLFSHYHKGRKSPQKYLKKRSETTGVLGPNNFGDALRGTAHWELLWELQTFKGGFPVCIGKAKRNAEVTQAGQKSCISSVWVFFSVKPDFTIGPFVCFLLYFSLQAVVCVLRRLLFNS